MREIDIDVWMVDVTWSEIDDVRMDVGILVVALINLLATGLLAYRQRVHTRVGQLEGRIHELRLKRAEKIAETWSLLGRFEALAAISNEMGPIPTPWEPGQESTRIEATEVHRQFLESLGSNRYWLGPEDEEVERLRAYEVVALSTASGQHKSGLSERWTPGESFPSILDEVARLESEVTGERKRLSFDR